MFQVWDNWILNLLSWYVLLGALEKKEDTEESSDDEDSSDDEESLLMSDVVTWHVVCHQSI